MYLKQELPRNFSQKNRLWHIVELDPYPFIRNVFLLIQTHHLRDFIELNLKEVFGALALL